MSVAQAREATKEFLAKLALGQEPDKKPDKPTKELTVGAFLDEYYIPWVIDNRKSGGATAKMLRRSFKAFWDVGVTKITQLDLERWQNEKMRSNKEASVNRVCSTIKTAFNWGVKRGILSDNPLAHVEKLKETTSPGRVRYLSDEERARLFEILEKHDMRVHDHLKPMIIVALNTGIRRGSLFGLLLGGHRLRARDYQTPR